MVEGITDRQGHSRAGSLWRILGYLPWFTADTATAVGVALRALALSLVGYALTRSTVAAGWLGTGAAVAQQGLSVFGGTFVDRHDRRRLLIVNAAVSAVCWGAVTALLAAGRLTFVVLRWCRWRTRRSMGSWGRHRTRCSRRWWTRARIRGRGA